MRDISTKVTGSVLTADEFNDIPSELENAITDTDIALSAGDLTQLSKSIANYVAGGSFYTDSGTSTGYSLDLIGSKQRPTEYFDGLAVSFIGGNDNSTSAPTVNVALLGSKIITTESGAPLEVGDISTTNISTLVFNIGTDRFMLRNATLLRGAKEYGSVASMKADPGLTIGDVVTLNGFTSSGDGGGKAGNVVAGATGTDDNGSYHDLDNGNQFEIEPAHYVDPRQWGAVFDGTTDDHTAIQACIDFAAGLYKVILPNGTGGMSEELKMPSDSWIQGQGKTASTLFLLAAAAKEENVITNAANDRTTGNAGNTNIVILDMTVDGNASRIGDPTGVPSTGSCGIGLANVEYAWIRNVLGKDNNKHAFDVSATVYQSSGDDPTTYPVGPSAHIKIEHCEGTGYGDDGITTHFSHDIDLINNFMHDSGDFLSVGNSNGIEIDDGSYDVRIFGGYALNCSRGLQIKGHDYAPAATNVRVFGLTCENCSQNFAFRHDGFDGGGDPKSETAFNLEIVGCTSIVPRQKGASGLDRRALNIQGYDSVRVKDFSVIGTDDLTPPGDPSNVNDATASSVIALFGNATNILLEGVTFKGVVNATTLVQVNNTASNVRIKDIRFWECDGRPINVDSATVGVQIDGVLANTTVTPPNEVIGFTNSPGGLDYTIKDVRFTGYTNAYNLNAVDYPDAVDIDNLNIHTTQKQFGIGTQAPARLLHMAFPGDSTDFFRIENTDVVVDTSESYGGIEWFGNDQSTDAAGIKAVVEAKATDGLGETELIISTTPTASTTLKDNVQVKTLSGKTIFIISDLPEIDPGIVGALYRTGSAVNVSI